MTEVRKAAHLAGDDMEIVRVEPLIEGWMREHTGTQTIRPDRTVERVQRIALLHYERKAGVDCPDAVGLPAAQDLMGHAMSESGRRGDLVKPTYDRIMRNVKGIDGLVSRSQTGVLVRPIVGEAEALVAPISLAFGFAVGISEIRKQTLAQALLVIDL